MYFTCWRKFFFLKFFWMQLVILFSLPQYSHFLTQSTSCSLCLSKISLKHNSNQTKISNTENNKTEEKAWHIKTKQSYFCGCCWPSISGHGLCLRVCLIHQWHSTGENWFFFSISYQLQIDSWLGMRLCASFFSVLGLLCGLKQYNSFHMFSQYVS